MIVLDTDHISELPWELSPKAAALVQKLRDAGEPIATTIVTAEEQMRGWLTKIKRQRTARRQIEPYRDLLDMFEFFARWRLLPWNVAAVDAFEDFKQQKIRIGTMNLKSAPIAIANDALLLSRNLKDFEKVPGLRVENWID